MDRWKSNSHWWIEEVYDWRSLLENPNPGDVFYLYLKAFDKALSDALMKEETGSKVHILRGKYFMEKL